MTSQTTYTTILNGMMSLLNQLFYAGNINDLITVIKSGSEISHLENVSKNDFINWQLAVSDVQIRLRALGVQDVESPHPTLMVLDVNELSDLQRGRQLDLIGNALYFDELGKKERDFTETREYLKQAIDILEALDEPRYFFLPLFHMGLTYQFDADYGKAMDYFARAENLTREHDFQTELSYAVRHIGFIHYFQENIDDALTYLKESLAIRQAIDLNIYLSLSNIAIADVYQSQGALGNAQPYYEDALKYARKIGIIRPLMVVLNSYANALRTDGEHAQALEYLHEALPYAEALNHEVAIGLITQQIQSIEESE